jgi:cell division protein FtsB
LNILIIYFGIIFIFSDKGVIKNDELYDLLRKSEIKYNNELKKYNELKNKIKLFKSNEHYQKKVIHKEIGYIEDNERIYIFSGQK